MSAENWALCRGGESAISRVTGGGREQGTLGLVLELAQIFLDKTRIPAP